MDPGFIASNSVNVDIADDEEPYGIARAIDSDDCNRTDQLYKIK
jgi:hypothetical protein